jgi:hypothetical protein
MLRSHGEMMPESPFLDQCRLTADTRRHFLGWGMGGLGAFFLNAAAAEPNAAKNGASAAALQVQHDPSAPLSRCRRLSRPKSGA